MALLPRPQVGLVFLDLIPIFASVFLGQFLGAKAFPQALESAGAVLNRHEIGLLTKKHVKPLVVGG